jgi:hypothetical protein
MARVNPGHAQRKRLLKANADRCCVCKRYGVGLHLHHIDEDPSNTVDANLAILCVEDHDRNHRPAAYRPQVNHLDLGPEQIRQHKISWEAFVIEARQPNPKVVATLAAYGTVELIHSLQLVMQWPDERIEYARSYHLLDGTLDELTDAVMEELSHIGQNVKLMVLNQPLPVEHCPCCGAGVSRTVKPAVVIRHTDPDWPTDSSCAVYINQETPLITVLFFLRQQQLLVSTLHLCRGRFLHYHGDGVDERIAVQPKPSIRAQATRILRTLLKEWSPAKVFIGTGDPDTQQLIDDLNLPPCWEIKR